MNKLLLLPILWLVWVLIAAPDRRAETANIQQALSAEVNLRSQALTSAMEKYRMVAVLLARSKVISDILDSDSPSTELVDRVGFMQAMSGVASISVLRRGDQQWYPKITAPSQLIESDQWRVGLRAAYQGTLGRAFYINDSGRPMYVFFAPHFAQEQPSPTAVVQVAIDLGRVRDSWDVSGNQVALWSSSNSLMMSNNVDRANKALSAERVHTQLGAVLRVSTSPPSLLGSWWLRSALVTTLLMVAGLLWLRQQERRKLLTELTEQRAGEAARLETVVKERTSELERAQKQLVLTEKLALLGQMSASISHEINQPLAAVKNYASTAVRLIERNNTKDAVDNLSQITNLSDRISRIVVNLRSFATNEPTPLQAVDLSEVLDESIAELVDRFPRAASFCKVVTPTMGSEIHAQAGRIRLLQVLANLLTNAWYACRNEAVPSVEVSLVIVDDRVEIGVRDNGQGFSDESAISAFDAFVSGRESDIGLGLGLSISRSFIESMDGTLVIKETTNTGALLVISLKRIT